LLHPRDRSAARDRLDPADAGLHSRLRGDGEGADLAGRAHVRPAAELLRKSADIHHSHSLLVLFAEERGYAALLSLVEVLDGRYQGSVLADAAIDQILDALDFLRRNRLRMSEVEAQAVGRDQGALLA